MRHCNDSEVMSMHAEMKKTIDEKIEEHSKPGDAFRFKSFLRASKMSIDSMVQ